MAEGRLSDGISLGVLAPWVPRDAVDDAVQVTGKGAKRKGGKLPPHVMVYFAMALALFAEEDYEEVWVRTQNALGVAGYTVCDGNPATSASMGAIPVTQAGNAVSGSPGPLSRFPSLEIRVAPATITLTAQGHGPSNGNGNGQGNGDGPGQGHGNGPGNGNGHGGGNGPGTGTGQAPGHNSAIAASAARAHCGWGTGGP